MEFRSTNDNGYSHIQGDFVTNVSSGGPINSSHGVHLTGGSTGGIVQSAGDETNIGLTVRGKGTGLLNLGAANAAINFVSTGTLLVGANSSLVTVGAATGNVRINSTGTFYGNASTSMLPMLQMYRVDWTVGALSSAGIDAAHADSTITVTGATTNSVYLLQRRGALNSTNSTGLHIEACCSTANEIRLTTYNTGASTISGSTMSAYLLQVQFTPIP